MISLDTYFEFLFGACMTPCVLFGLLAFTIHTARSYRVTKLLWPHPLRTWIIGAITFWSLLGSLLFISATMTASYMRGPFASFAILHLYQVLRVAFVVMLGSCIGMMAWYYGMYKPAAQRFGSPDNLASLSHTN